MLVTGATGNLGQSICTGLEGDYTVVGLDRDRAPNERRVIEMDITSEISIREALAAIRRDLGSRIAAIVHLIAYFDFSGEPDALYNEVNEKGISDLLGVLEDFEVGRFIYASTMLVHRPGVPGERINEQTPLDPRWVYPRSKARAEAAIRSNATMPYAILRLAGVYDEQTAVPTLSHQIARIYSRDLQSHLYAGPLDAGQAMLHREDLIDAVRRTIARRLTLPTEVTMLIGEPETLGYDTIQEMLGRLIHGEHEWQTLKIPVPVAKLGSKIQNLSEPLIPDVIDGGDKPFIQPYMIDMADDHYELDISLARNLLDWEPQHRLGEELPGIVENLKADPVAWHEMNGVAFSRNRQAGKR